MLARYLLVWMLMQFEFESRAPRFSRGIRQRLKAAADAGGWREKHAIRVDNHDEDADRTYTDLLATSVFCFVLPGEHDSSAWPAPSAVHASRPAGHISMSASGLRRHGMSDGLTTWSPHPVSQAYALVQHACLPLASAHRSRRTQHSCLTM